ncbi:MAG: DUF721 domain-containing protein [Spirochaetia bacterium]|nr:DUF721 domain-containing protein [Spirochaetia bacterium]
MSGEAKNGPGPWKEADDRVRSSVTPLGFTGSEMDGILGVVMKDRPDAREALVLSRSQSRWPQAAGSLAKHSWPEKYSHGRLTVRMSSDAYAQDFMMYRTDILKRLRGFGLTEITSLYLQKGRPGFKVQGEAAAESIPAARPPHETTMTEGARELADALRKMRNDS